MTTSGDHLPPADFKELSEEDKAVFPSNQEIMVIVKTIRERAVKGESTETVAKDFPDFARLLPHLMMAAMSPPFPLDLLEFMLQKTEKLSDDGEGIVQADSDVYEKLQAVYGKK
jgi:hypothetical protein